MPRFSAYHLSQRYTRDVVILLLLSHPPLPLFFFSSSSSSFCSLRSLHSLSLSLSHTHTSCSLPLVLFFFFFFLQVLGSEQDEEALYRGLVALGTLVWDDEAAKALVRDLDLIPSVQKQTSSSFSKVKELATELCTYLLS